MTGPPPLSLGDGLRQTRLTYDQLWHRYLALGGSGTMAELHEHIDADGCPDSNEHNLIAQALNDTFVEGGHDHPVAYQHLYTRPAP